MHVSSHGNRITRRTVLAGTCALWSSCTRSQQESRPGKVTLAAVVPGSMFQLPVVLAQELGCFRDEGLPISACMALLLGSAPNARVAAVETGKVDAAMLGDPGASLLQHRYPSLLILADT